MKIAGYEFAENSRFQPGAVLQAKDVGSRLEELRKKFKGELTPKDVVDDARSKRSPLHSFFEWNDSGAAEAFRLTQARGLIRSVVAIYTHTDKPATRLRAFVHIPEPGAPHYRELSDAMSKTATRTLILQRAWRELTAWRQRYQDLKDFSDLFKKIEEIERNPPKALKAVS
jgi:hypothetical protein